MIVFKHGTNEITSVDVHTVSQEIEVKLFDKDKDLSEEFLVIESWDRKAQEVTKWFFSGPSLEKLMEQMNIISALRIRNK
jgi:hypothetical protein